MVGGRSVVSLTLSLAYGDAPLQLLGSDGTPLRNRCCHGGRPIALRERDHTEAQRLPEISVLMFVPQGAHRGVRGIHSPVISTAKWR